MEKHLSPFMNWYCGNSPQPGSFFRTLYQAFLQASHSNKLRLISAFPESFYQPDWELDLKAYEKYIEQG